MAGPVLQTVSLGMQWPTLDPFLFCVHHLDRYPIANERFGPAASLEGRDLGQDFAGLDGWRMYHGDLVPGFPAHPHRGFETVTYVRRGFIDHADSLGAAARYGRGDVQWMTAGVGIVHAEMFPLLDRAVPNTVELFQIWINLPADTKLVEPHFSMFWDDQVPRLRDSGEHDEGSGVEVTVIAGAIGDHRPPNPPPNSWAHRPESEVAIWHIRLDAGGRWTMPAASGPEVNRVLYVFDGAELHVEDQVLTGRTGAVIRADAEVVLSAPGPAEALMLQGRPIAEPVARYGPFVMNTEAEIRQAMTDYQRTRFGGWPWPADDPVHGASGDRFARHLDGTVERAAD